MVGHETDTDDAGGAAQASTAQAPKLSRAAKSAIVAATTVTAAVWGYILMR